MSTDPNWSARWPVIVGTIGLVVLVGGFGLWGGTTQISGAVVTSGTVEVESFRQVVQHQQGGIVSELLVKEGSRVKAGDTLIRLDDTVVRSERAIVEGQLHEFLARHGRLTAERDGLSHITFGAEIVSYAEQDTAVLDLLEGQSRLFVARQATFSEETAQLKEKTEQIENHILGLKAQLASVAQQIELVERERADQQSLLDKGLTRSTRVLTLERERKLALDDELNRLDIRAPMPEPTAGKSRR